RRLREPGSVSRPVPTMTAQPPTSPERSMTLMAAGVACLTVSVLWHACLAVASAREAARWAAGAPASGPARAGDGGAAAPSVLWLVLVNPTPVTLAAVRAVGLRLRCRTRAVLVVSDLS